MKIYAANIYNKKYLHSKKQIKAGNYLVSVYGDNYIGKTHFNLLCVPASDSASSVSISPFFFFNF